MDRTIATTSWRSGPSSSKCGDRTTCTSTSTTTTRRTRRATRCRWRRGSVRLLENLTRPLFVRAEAERVVEHERVLAIDQAGRDQLDRADLVGRERQRLHHLFELSDGEQVRRRRRLDHVELVGREPFVVDRL